MSAPIARPVVVLPPIPARAKPGEIAPGSASSVFKRHDLRTNDDADTVASDPAYVSALHIRFQVGDRIDAFCAGRQFVTWGVVHNFGDRRVRLVELSRTEVAGD